MCKIYIYVYIFIYTHTHVSVALLDMVNSERISKYKNGLKKNYPKEGLASDAQWYVFPQFLKKCLCFTDELWRRHHAATESPRTASGLPCTLLYVCISSNKTQPLLTERSTVSQWQQNSWGGRCISEINSPITCSLKNKKSLETICPNKTVWIKPS